ncbi:hypothetical protein JCM16303_007282 [Sporobolomyces ruberrimus]
MLRHSSTPEISTLTRASINFADSFPESIATRPDSTIPLGRGRSMSVPNESSRREIRSFVKNLASARSAAETAALYCGDLDDDTGHKGQTFLGAFLYYLYEIATSWLFVLVTSPSLIFFDPLSTLYALIIYPLLWTALAVIVLNLWIGRRLGFGKIVDGISKNHFRGLSPVNWVRLPLTLSLGTEEAQLIAFRGQANSGIFDAGGETISHAVAIRGGRYRTTLPPPIGADQGDPAFTPVKTIRVFSIPLARALLPMSALVYERDDTLVLSARQDVIEAKQEDQSPNAKERLLAKARTKTEKSEKTLKDQATKWHVEFSGVCELATKSGGPFASVFTNLGSISPQDPPFIVLVFKGTGPTNFSEILIDASIDRVSAAPFFGPGSGNCQRGFYTSLFEAEDSHRAAGSDSYGTILRFLKVTAERTKQRFKETYGSRAPPLGKIPLWITGHSLGGGLASICFARFLNSPEDLGSDLELRDCYGFGTPRCGDGDFASAFENSLVSPRDRSNILWRVENQFDVVTRLPFGIADRESSRATLSSVSPLNYAHLGPCMSLRPLFPLFASYRPSWKVQGLRAFHAATDVWVAGNDYEGEAEALIGGTLRHRSLNAPTSDWMDEFLSGTEGEQVVAPNRLRKMFTMDKLRKILKNVFAPFYDHCPAAYLENIAAMQSTVLSDDPF